MSTLKTDNLTSDTNFVATNANVSVDISASSSGIIFPKGTTSQRPTTVATGKVAGAARYNTSREALEYYDGQYWWDFANRSIIDGIVTDGLELLYDPGSIKSWKTGNTTFNNLKYPFDSPLTPVNSPVHTSGDSGFFTYTSTSDRTSANTKYFRNLNHQIPNITNCTLSIWIQMPSIAVGHNIPFWISDASNRMFFIDTRSDYNWLQICTENFSLNVRPTSSQSQITNGNWHNIVAIRRPSGCSLFIDNTAISVTQNNGYGGWGISPNDLTIGASLDSGGYYTSWLPGGTSAKIGPIQFWTKALSTTEINKNYNYYLSRYS